VAPEVIALPGRRRLGHGGDFVEIATGAERTALAGDHERAHRVVGAEAGQRVDQGVDRGVVQRVAPLRPAEFQQRDAVFVHRQADTWFLSHVVVSMRSRSIALKFALCTLPLAVRGNCSTTSSRSGQ
jgi:hypothetical protein